MVTQELWERIPPDSDVVLYLACGDGSRAGMLLQRYPQMTLVGVETDAALRRKAEQYGFFVAESAAAALVYLEKTGIFVDAWVIERRAWQDETLTCVCRRQLLDHLRKGATLAWEFASIQYWRHLMTLIQGQTDATVRHNLLDLASELKQAGVPDVEIFGSKTDETNPEFAIFRAAMKPLIDAMKDPAQHLEMLYMTDTLTLRGWYQPQVSEPLHITAILGETKVCARVRVDEPHEFLATLPLITCKRFEQMDEAAVKSEKRHVWIWQRRLFSHDRMVDLQRQLLGHKALTIQEWDDDPLHWEEHFHQSRFAELLSSHAIQTSTPVLAEYLRQFNPEVKIFPNCIAALPPLRFPAGPGTTIFFGALNRQEDWAPIMPALNRVLQKYGKRVRIFAVYDREFFDSLQCSQKKFFTFCSYPNYQKLLQMSDVALLPLMPTRFNRMKSDLKFLECAAWGTVSLTSPTVYADTVIHGETGLLYETEEQFRLGLEQLIEDAQLRQRLAGNAWRWVRDNRLLSMHYRDRLRWYESLFDRYDELTEAIGARVPELRRGIR